MPSIILPRSYQYAVSASVSSSPVAEGESMSVTAQYLDTVNVPPPAFLPMLWAPVGLRYHALHHLIPGVPYHALGEAHRRLSAALDHTSPYHQASYPGLPGLVARIARSTMVVRR